MTKPVGSKKACEAESRQVELEKPGKDLPALEQPGSVWAERNGKAV
jgi:hypothetical protein